MGAYLAKKQLTAKTTSHVNCHLCSRAKYAVHIAHISHILHIFFFFFFFFFCISLRITNASFVVVVAIVSLKCNTVQQIKIAWCGKNTELHYCSYTFFHSVLVSIQNILYLLQINHIRKLSSFTYIHVPNQSLVITFTILQWNDFWSKVEECSHQEMCCTKEYTRFSDSKL